VACGYLQFVLRTVVCGDRVRLFVLLFSSFSFFVGSLMILEADPEL
jgi:hypothetical protein